MATWGEKPNTAKVAKDSVTLTYILTGAENRIIALAMARGYSSVLFGSLFRTKIDATEIGPQMYECEINYGPIDKKEPEAGDVSWRFDTTGATKHVAHAIAHIATYPTSDAPYDHKSLIGVTSDSVDGVDVQDRAFKWSETHQLAIGSYGFTYGAILGEYTGRYNTASFRGFAAGTVKFCGANGGKSGKDPDLVEVTFNFEVSPSDTNLAVGDITGIAKGGWDYLWVRCAEKKDDTMKTTVLTPVQVEIDQVMKSFDFSTLGIGTGSL
jgi:hypothetical protein